MGRYSTIVSASEKPWIYNFVGSNKTIKEISDQQGCTVNEVLQECINHAIDPVTTFHFDPRQHKDISTHWVYQYIGSGKPLEEVAKEQNLTESEVLISLLAVGKQQIDLETKGKKLIGLDVGTSRLLTARRLQSGIISVKPSGISSSMLILSPAQVPIYFLSSLVV